MRPATCGTRVTVCIRQQLVTLYLCWFAATGIAIMFVVVPGSQTLLQFQRTECTTVHVARSGENSCTFCLQIHVVTKDLPVVRRQLQQDEVIEDTWCTFRSSCKMRDEKATTLLDGLMKSYGVNGSTYSCFSHKSPHSTLTVLAIKRYPQSTLMQLILWLSLSCFILIVCTLHSCHSTSKNQARKEAMKSGYRNKKAWTRMLSFHWKWSGENGTNQITDNGFLS